MPKPNWSLILPLAHRVFRSSQLLPSFTRLLTFVALILINLCTINSAHAAPSDFNLDAKSDLVLANSNGLVDLWLMNGTTVTSKTTLLNAPGWAVSHIADFNGDGKADLLFRNTDGRIAMWLMNGATFISGAGLLGAGSGWTVTHVADFNGDGKADILFRHTDGRIAMWLMDGLSLSSGGGLLEAASGWDVTHTGDFNGDGKADLLFRHTDGRIAMWLMDGLSLSSGGGLLEAASGWSVTHTGDFNGDGKSDILYSHTDGRIAMWLMNGLSLTSGGGMLNAATGWSTTLVADFNGDGKADILYRHTDGRIALWLMNGIALTSGAGLLNAASGWTVTHTGDFNGDGKADLIFLNTDGRIAIWLMNGTALASGGGLTEAGTGWQVVLDTGNPAPVITPNKLPTVSLTAPTVAISLVAGTSVNLAANASDTDGVVVKVEFLASGVKLGEATQTPYVFRWTPSVAGTYSITARATDNGNGSLATAAISVTVTTPTGSTTLPTQAEAARFLTQATFGPNMTTINEVATKDYSRWIEEQLALPLSNPSHWKYVVIDKGPKGDSRFINSTMESFWQQAVRSQDQLRQRTTFALSEIFVVSTINGAVDIQQDAHASYLDMLSRNAFGNYRTLLEEVSIHPTMAIYLSWFKNEKEVAGGRQPDENYAREVMQLFSIGLWQLNLDGTRKVDANGKFIPTYSQDDIIGMARVFTGWSWGQDPATNDPTNFGGPPVRWDLPMQAYPAYHSSSEKRIINGVVIPVNTGPEESLRIALDTIFNHPNVGPFIGSQLIKRFVTSNPSPAYISRVASAFNNNGAGVRGDMKAVMRAVLLDVEARSATVAAGPTAGKLREPIVRFANFMRAFDVKTAPIIVYRIWNLEDPVESIGQNPLRAPSVFNWYRPDYSPPGTILGMGLVAPEFQITHETTVTGYTNFVTANSERQTESFRAIMAQYEPIDEYLAADVSSELALTDQPDALIDRLNLLLLYGKITPSLRNTVRQAINNIGLTEYRARDKRVAVATALIMASPQYVVQK